MSLKEKKVIYCGCQRDPWLPVAVSLYKKKLLKPVYWTALKELEPDLKAVFGDVLFHDVLDAIRGIPAVPLADMPALALDQSLVDALAPTQLIALKMMDRMGPQGNFSHLERVRFYYQHLNYWWGVLQRFKPDLVVFPETPHMVYDYILYSLCLHFDVPTVMLAFSPLPGRFYARARFDEPISSITRCYQRLLQQYETNAEVVLPPDLENFWQNKCGSYDQGKPANILWLNMDLGLSFYDLNSYKHITKSILQFWKWPEKISRAYRFLVADAPPNYVKAKGKSLDSYYMRGLEWRLMRKRGTKQKRRLFRLYKSLATTPDLTAPFIFVALHYQPEAATSPLAKAYADQMLIVSALARVVPRGWKVYVKEHLTSFSRMGESDYSRNAAFYEDLSAIPNVQFISLDVSPFELIDASRAVATATGSVGLESVIRGKPCLAFGYASYLGCDGVYPVMEEADLKDAIARINSGELPEKRKVKTFLQAAADTSLRSYLDPKMQSIAGITAEKNADNIYQVLSDALYENRGI